MIMYQMTNEDRECLANQVKDCLLQYLCNHDEIDSERFEELSKTIAMVIRKPSFFSRFYKSSKDEEYVIKAVRIGLTNVEE